jgi:protein-disulfide reductase (glutathione)
VEAAKAFVMVNILDEKQADEEANQPDGSYIPRVLFYSPVDGKPDTKLYNEKGSPRYKFYYPSADDLLHGMQVAAAKYPPKPETKEL